MLATGDSKSVATHIYIYIHTGTYYYIYMGLSRVFTFANGVLVGNSTWLLEITMMLSENLVLQGESFVHAPFSKQCQITRGYSEGLEALA